MSGVHEQHLDTPFLKNLVQGNPIDAGGLHGDGVDAASLEPIGQTNQILREALELPYGLIVSVIGNSDPVTLGSYVDSCGIEMDLLQEALLAL
jgi:hypothetical protein